MKNKKHQIREAFHKAVFTRDHNKCRFCEKTEDLDAHHITDRHEFPNGGYVKENGISVCPEHHLLCEEWHSKGVGLPTYSPESLYTIICSTKELAMKADAKHDHKKHEKQDKEAE